MGWDYCLRIRWALMRRRILFLRHFHRMWPRFFQTRELRFIPNLSETARGTFLPLKGLLRVPLEGGPTAHHR